MDVTIDRDKWIGGSDEPVIMGISHFKTRWTLLQEKLNPESVVPFTNEYVEYGNMMEAPIRKFVETTYNTTFKQDEAFREHVRYHSDGFDGKRVLEVKTTSQIHDDISGYKHYLVQLLIGMWVHEVDKGILAVYERGDEEFDPFRLQIFDIHILEYEGLLEEVLKANGLFWADLEYLRENPLATEEELPSNTEIVPIVNEIVVLEKQYAIYKALEAELKAKKQLLYELMTDHSIKWYETNDKVRFTRVAETEGKTEEVFDEDKFKAECPDEWAKYQKTVVKKGKAGYVRISGISKKRGE